MGGLELLLPVLILIPLLLITFRGRKQQKAYAETQRRLAPGMDVMTSAGLYGHVEKVDGDEVVLRVADGVRLRWAKAAIGRIVTAPTGSTPGTDGVELTKRERTDG